MRATIVGLSLLACSLVPAAVRAVIPRLSTEDIGRALAIARGPESGRARFHAQYVFDLDNATVERIEVLTPFRRAELFGEDRLRMGDHMFGVRDAQLDIASWQNTITIRSQLRFNPLNVYVTVPEFDVVVGDPAAGGLRVPPLRVSRTPIFAVGGRARKNAGQPIMGATIDAVFDAAAVGGQTWPVGVWLKDQMYAAVPVRFGEIE
ncbi:MAG: hypothetical protein ACM3SQ_13165 [Betaproteobacteria bacterium]